MGRMYQRGGWVGGATNLSRPRQPRPLDGCPMFALSRTWVEEDLFPMLSLPVCTYLEEKEKEGFAIFFNPCTRKREHGAPVQGSRLGVSAQFIRLSGPNCWGIAAAGCAR
jgi:hypothetical protein